MGYTENLRLFFVVMTIIVLGTVSIVRVGAIDMHAIITTALILVPATVIMGYLGQRMGEIMDNPKNRADADYKLDALKKMDKSITLQELNEKLTKQVAEPDLPEAPDDDIDV